MTRSSAISSLEYGIALCDITKTLLVHIPVEEAKEILKVLESYTPVVRCGDCLHWEPECVEAGDSSGHCRNNYAPCQNQQTDMNWFCAEGERSDAP